MVNKKRIEEIETTETRAVERATEIEQWPLARLKPYKRNAKNHPPEQIALLAKIMAKHGFDVPIVVDKKGVIVKGHGRWLAARELRLPTVPVIVRDLTPAQSAEARIADNRVGEFGWDFDALVADVVGGLKDGLDMDVTGWTLKELGLDKSPQDDGGSRTGPIDDTVAGDDGDEKGTGEIELGEGAHKCPRCQFTFG